MNEAERVVMSMLAVNNPDNENDEYVWEKYEHIPYKRMPIQAWTALLKGYVHGGMMAKADSLFNALCHDRAGGGNGPDSKKRKRSESAGDNRANVRTLNTLLRGCLWSATSINDDMAVSTEHQKKKGKRSNKRNQLVGGIATAERAWMQFANLTHTSEAIFDSSSYEYFITLLCQSLQSEKANLKLKEMKEQFKLSNDLANTDPTLIESLVFCHVALARAYALMGKMNDVQRYTGEALRMIQHLESPASQEDRSAKKNSKIAIGGKQAWKSENDADGSNRRHQSNALFRSHRIAELKTEATALSHHSSSSSSSHRVLAKLLMTRLIYFSGGGTTGLNDITGIDSASETCSNSNVHQSVMNWYNSLWFSFGLKEAMQQFDQDGTPSSTASSNVVNADFCNKLRTRLLGKDHRIITEKGYIDFGQVFSNAPLNIELGSGSGDWAIIQAESNPPNNYVTVELRADRVAQTFAKIALRNQTNNNQALHNLCCVGSECNLFLRQRVRPGTVRTIFVNHPEPPTQTSTSDDQAHMLNAETMMAAANCLEPDGRGRIIIVTDNLVSHLLCLSMYMSTMTE
jgi:pentatricopeptide repeat protein